MAKYFVYIQEIHTAEIAVEAPTKKQALERAEQVLEGELPCFEYSNTVDSYDWPIREVDEWPVGMREESIKRLED